jgi:hypothetical protein
MTELRTNSIAGEYYHGDLPGTLQYKKTKAELTTIPNIYHMDSDCGYVQIPPKADLLKRFVPDTLTGRNGDWKLLVVFQKVAESEIWMKGALLNRKDGCIALMTCANEKEHIERRDNRALKSLEDGWFVGHYRMGAPMIFWRGLAAALEDCD